MADTIKRYRFETRTRWKREGDNNSRDIIRIILRNLRGESNISITRVFHQLSVGCRVATDTWATAFCFQITAATVDRASIFTFQTAHPYHRCTARNDQPLHRFVSFPVTKRRRFTNVFHVPTSIHVHSNTSTFYILHGRRSEYVRISLTIRSSLGHCVVFALHVYGIV